MDKEKQKSKRIGIDARFYGQVGKGLGRYTKEVVDRVIKMDRGSEYIIFLGQDNFFEFKDELPRVKKVLADVRWYTLAEQIKLPFLIWRERLDLMHFPHFNVPLLTPVKFIVTIHDLILTKFPTRRATTLSPLTYFIKNQAYRIIIRMALRRARKIIAVSKFTKKDIVKQFNIDKNKIFVSYEGIFQPEFNNKNLVEKNAISRYNIHKPYLLYVGNAYPHKNLEGLITTFIQINKIYPNIRLVLVGKDDYFYLRVKKFAQKVINSKQSIIFPGFIPDNDLALIYKQALAYVFPSLYEGFGLPPLEAMTYGCPVVSSNRTSMPEILGPAALYFNPDNAPEMQAMMTRIITEDDLRQSLINKGYSQVKKYSWNKCAMGTLAIYKNIK